MILQFIDWLIITLYFLIIVGTGRRRIAQKLHEAAGITVLESISDN
jgi:hypothetical protein